MVWEVTWLVKSQVCWWSSRAWSMWPGLPGGPGPPSSCHHMGAAWSQFTARPSNSQSASPVKEGFMTIPHAAIASNQ